MPRTHVLEGPYSSRFDNSVPPVVTIDPGDTVIFVCREALDGQLTPESTVEDYKKADMNRLHSMVGPVAVAGAEPGDTLVVEILEFEHHGWGWTAIEPGLGLLSEDFGDTWALKIWKVGADGRAIFNPQIRVPVEPFLGLLGVAPAEPGSHRTPPPRRTGGNMDIRHLVAGSTLYLPVEVPGALFWAGDGHLAQGDGEVCLSAIEAPLTATLRFQLRKGVSIPEPRYVTPRPANLKTYGMGEFATTASGPDLFRNAQQAVRYMLDWLQEEHGLTREEAYILCSVAGDLKIAEIVDRPNWLVSFHMPLSIFTRD